MLDVLAENIDRGFQTLPDILENVLMKALQLMVKAMRQERNLEP